LNKVTKDLSAALMAASEGHAVPSEIVDDVIGVNTIPAMTIHKSKGLEFHTVIFLGLEDSQWWNFSKKPDEEKRGFFVAFSRAIQRVIFTYCDSRKGRYGPKRQSRTEINDLYTVLKEAGVTTKDHRTGS
jgi:superfamily I DNA/RNA helicase